MDDLEIIRKRLGRMTYRSVTALSRKTGIPVNTLWNIGQGNTKNPRFVTIKTLADYYKAKA